MNVREERGMGHSDYRSLTDFFPSSSSSFEASVFSLSVQGTERDSESAL